VKVIISSFGYKYGTPIDADLLLDARTLLNPFTDKSLRNLPGTSDAVWRFVTADPRWYKWKAKAEFEAVKLLDIKIKNGARDMIIGIGCHGGRHRSVVATLELARFFHWQGGLSLVTKPGTHQVMVGHRDMIKAGKDQKPLRNLRDIKLAPAKKFAGT